LLIHEPAHVVPILNAATFEVLTDNCMAYSENFAKAFV